MRGGASESLRNDDRKAGGFPHSTAAKPRLSMILSILLIGGCFVAVFFLSPFIGTRRPQLPENYPDADLSLQPAKARGFALGMEGLLADWYFMRALQYIGAKVLAHKGTINIDNLRDLNPRLLYPLLDSATDLDPHFIAAYSYGAVVLPAIDPEKAIALGEKGVANNRDQWRLYQHLGYVYWRVGDYAKAAETFERGSGIEGASAFMRLMAAAMKTEGGSRETARAMYREMLAASDDAQVRITAERRLKEIEWLEERDAIDRVLDDHQKRTGRCPADLKEITNELLQIKLAENDSFGVDNAGRLADPTGAPYLFDREACRVKLDPARTGLPPAEVRTK